MSARNGNVQSIFGGPRSTRALCAKSDFSPAPTQSKSLFGGPRSTRGQCVRAACDPNSQPRRPPPANGQQQHLRQGRPGPGPGPSSAHQPAQRPIQKQAQKRDFSGMFDSDSDGEERAMARTPVRQPSGGVPGQQGVPNVKRIKTQSGQPVRQVSRAAVSSDATLRTGAGRPNPNGAKVWKSTQAGGRGQSLRSCQSPGRPPTGNIRPGPGGQVRQVVRTSSGRIQQRPGQPTQAGARPMAGQQRPQPGRQLPPGADPKRAAAMGSRPGQPLTKRQASISGQNGRILQGGGVGGARPMAGLRPGQQNGNLRPVTNGLASQGGRLGRGAGRGLPVRGGGIGRGIGRGGGVGIGVGSQQQQQLQRGIGRGGRGTAPQGRGGMVDGRRPPPQQQMQQRPRGAGVQSLFSQANGRKTMNGAAAVGVRAGRGRGQMLQRGIKRRMDGIPDDLKGFIEDGEESNDWKSELQKITRYDGTRFHHIDDADDPSMEVGWKTCLAEERLSARKGREEDAREEMLELMRKQKQGGTSSEDERD